MWQFVFVAAVTAGSGILVKRFFRNADADADADSEREDDHDHPSVRVSSVSDQTKQGKEEEEKKNVKPDALITSFGDSWRSEKQNTTVVEDEGIFRFSSLDRGDGSVSGSRSGLLNKAGLKGNVISVNRRRSSSTTSSRADKKLLMFMLEDQMNKGRKKVSFCLKRRRTTCKNVFRKCGSCSSSKGNSLFSCGVGFGFMYLLSARKAEINKLNVDIEETTEVISNLQSEVCKRKLSRDLQDSGCTDRANMETMGKSKKPLLMTDSSVKLASPDDPEALGLSSNGDGECASSILTEEVDLEALEMDKLEAELECELQKIPNEPDPEYFMEFPSTELSAYALEGPEEPLGMDPNSSQFYGVSPTELDRKLCHVLIKQQESQIAELESNLYLSQLKLHEKDAELQTLKAVVCSLRDFSLETASDDEAEDGVVLDDEENEMNSNADSLIYPRSVDDGSNKIVIVKDQKSLCGVKRVMEFESYANCQVNHTVML